MSSTVYKLLQCRANGDFGREARFLINAHCDQNPAQVKILMCAAVSIREKSRAATEDSGSEEEDIARYTQHIWCFVSAPSNAELTRFIDLMNGSSRGVFLKFRQSHEAPAEEEKVEVFRWACLPDIFLTPAGANTTMPHFDTEATMTMRRLNVHIQLWNAQSARERAETEAKEALRMVAQAQQIPDQATDAIARLMLEKEVGERSASLERITSEQRSALNMLDAAQAVIDRAREDIQRTTAQLEKAANRKDQ